MAYDFCLLHVQHFIRFEMNYNFDFCKPNQMNPYDFIQFVASELIVFYYYGAS